MNWVDIFAGDSDLFYYDAYFIQSKMQFNEIRE